MVYAIVTIVSGAVGLILLLSIVNSAGLPTWIATVMAGVFGAAQMFSVYPLRFETVLAVAVGTMAACALAERIVFRSATAFRFAACGSAIATAVIFVGSSFDHPPLEWQDEMNMYLFGSHGSFRLEETDWDNLLQSVSMAFAICGFALGSFRRHSFVWSRHLYRVCVSLVLLYLLGLIWSWLWSEYGAPLILYKRLFWPAISVACFGIFLQVAAGVQIRIAARPTPTPSAGLMERIDDAREVPA